MNDLFNAAQTAFYSGDYDGALKSVNDAIALAKNDAVLHEFRSLVLFAQGKYQESAAAIHSVLAVGPGWDWTTLISLYPSVDTYTQQLRKLEEAVKGVSQRCLAAFPAGVSLHHDLGDRAGDLPVAGSRAAAAEGHRRPPADSDDRRREGAAAADAAERPAAESVGGPSQRF